MPPAVRCPKCGLMQLPKPKCKACGTPIGTSPPQFIPPQPQSLETQSTREKPPEGSPSGMNGFQPIPISYLLGIVGSIVLFIGVFMPFVRVPIYGSMTYFRNGRGDGVIILIFAVASFALVILKRFKWLWLTGLASFGTLMFTFINFQIALSQARSHLKNSLAGNPFARLAEHAFGGVELQWGWAFLVVGAVLLVAAAVHAEGLQAPRDFMGWLRRVAIALATFIRLHRISALAVSIVLILSLTYHILYLRPLTLWGDVLLTKWASGTAERIPFAEVFAIPASRTFDRQWKDYLEDIQKAYAELSSITSRTRDNEEARNAVRQSGSRGDLGSRMDVEDDARSEIETAERTLGAKALAAETFAKNWSIRQGRADADGHYELNLRPGRYYLFVTQYVALPNSRVIIWIAPVHLWGWSMRKDLSDNETLFPVK